MGKATILGFSPNLAAMISSGGRISTMEGTAGQIWQKSLELGEEKNERLIGKVVSSGHTSVLEHGYVNLSFENVSVFAEQFLIEFRLASFTVKSRRYVDFSNCGWVTPFADAARAAVYDAEVRRLFGVYDALCAAGVPKEDARFVLPYGFHSNFFCSMNARELVHVMNELTYGRGSGIPELRALGESLFAQCEAQAPYLALRKEREYAVQPPAVPAGEALRCDAAVTLLDGTAEPERLICRAWQIGQGRMPTELDDAQMRDVLAALLRQPRKRELQQASFTLLFGGMSLAALTHLTRHRMQALVAPELLKNADYGRYVLPQSVLECGMEEVYRAAFSGAAACAERLESMGADETQLCYLLLSGQTVPAVATMNAGELYTFFRLRTCTRAQWEIRAIAVEALHVLRKAHPLLFALYGPTCFMTGHCPEGKMCCGRQAEIRLAEGDTPLGVLGELHPDTAERFGLDTRVYAAELRLPPLFASAGDKRVIYRPLPRYPAVERDLALVCDEALPVAEIKDTIRRSGGRHLESVELFDVYQGAQIEQGKKSVAFSLRFRGTDGTLSDGDIEPALQKIFRNLQEKGCILRS